MKHKEWLHINLFVWVFFIGLTNELMAQQNQPIKGLMSFEGQQREYIYFAPNGLKKNTPLVVVLHGFTSSAEKIMNYSHFNELAGKHQFAVVYPQGSMDEKGNTFWNVGYDFHKNSKVNDTGFLISLIKTIQNEHELSAENTFLTGMSNGGEMTYLLGCMYPDHFKAIAPVAGTMFTNFFDQCISIRNTPVLAIFGTKDDVTRYNGDPENEDGWGVYKSIPDIIEYWAQAIDFDKTSQSKLKDLDTSDGSQVIKSKYENSQNGNQVLFYQVIGGGHEWPGAWGNKDIDATEEIWAFFNSYVL